MTDLIRRNGSGISFSVTADDSLRDRFDLKVFVDAINLNDRPTREFQGGVSSQITEHEYTGRTFMFGISTRFGR